MSCLLGSEHLGAGQVGGGRPRVGSCLPAILGSNESPPPLTHHYSADLNLILLQQKEAQRPLPGIMIV